MPAETWLPLTQLADELGCSRGYIKTMRSHGLLIPGEHFYAIGARQAVNSKKVYCLERVRETLLKLTAEAAAQAPKPMPVIYDDEHLTELIEEVRK